jgi:hypothetical protein
VTPDVLGDLQEALAGACDSGSLPMGKEEALGSLQAVADDFGLPVAGIGSGPTHKTAEHRFPIRKKIPRTSKITTTPMVRRL